MRRVSSLDAETHERLKRACSVAKGPRLIQMRQLFEASLLPHLLDWGQHFLPHYFTNEPSQMHLEIVESLQWRHQERAVKEARIAPRGGAKTTWVSKIYPLFCVCHDLEEYILLIGDSSEQAEENLEAIRHELEQNDPLAEEYPHATGIGPKWNVSQIITRNGIKIHAAGTRKKVRGRGHRAARPSLIIIDDLENDEGVMSETQRVKVWKWLNRALLPAGQPKTNVLFVGTALHPEDALQKIVVQAGWRSKAFGALVREPTNQALWDEWRTIFRNLSIPPVERDRLAREFYEANQEAMDYGAELLWPDRESLYYLMVWRETNGEQAFQAEKQGNAAAVGATEFGSELFGGSIWFDVWPDLTLKAMALDPSKGQNEKNDYSAFVWGGLGPDGNIYVDADIARRDAMQVVTDGIEIYRQFLPRSFGVESVMFLQLFATMFGMEAIRQGILLPVVEIHPHEQKLVRIRQLTPYLRAGRIRFRAGSRGAEMLVDQLKRFPGAQHDDGPDALHMMFELMLQLSGIDGAGGNDAGGEQVITT